ncbi:MAG: hypothetical protein ABSG53_29595 [Thermoguttaceae bacterium]|jgi:hypothetical protein
MATFLKIENPGVCPIEGFILLGATSKRLADNDSPYTVGQFGSGNKHALNVLLRANLNPVVFCGNHRLEFTTKPGKMKALEGDTSYNRVVVKHGGTDEDAASVTYSEELSQTDEYGILDWNCLGMAFREFVSNSIDAAIAVNKQAKENAKWPWDGVKIELVPEEKVRAKRGFTRVFVPADNEEVIRFFANLGKWFLHFSEPESIMQAILPKKGRNLDPDCKTAVIYRRGVRVREIDQYSPESLFDYNLNDLRVDESRNVDDYACRNAATKAMAKANPEILASWIQSFRGDTSYWEHGFGGYELKPQWGETPEEIATRKANWNKALEIVGDSVVLATKDGPLHTLEGKGYDPLEVPETVVKAAEEYGCPTPSKVLSADELDGRESFDPTPDAVAALDWVWDRVNHAGMDDGKARPPIRCFRKVMDGGTVVHGFLRDGVVYVNEDLAVGACVELRQTVLEEVAHYLSGSRDCTRDLQDWAFKLAVRVAMAVEPVAG